MKFQWLESKRWYGIGAIATIVGVAVALFATGHTPLDRPGFGPSRTPSLSTPAVSAPVSTPSVSAREVGGPATFLDNLLPSGGDQPTEHGLAIINGQRLSETLVYGVGIANPHMSTQYSLPGPYSMFMATLGLAQATCDGLTVRFQMAVDGKIVIDVVVPEAQNAPVSVSISGGHQLELSVDYITHPCGAGVMVNADWGNAQVRP